MFIKKTHLDAINFDRQPNNNLFRLLEQFIFIVFT